MSENRKGEFLPHDSFYDPYSFFSQLRSSGGPQELDAALPAFAGFADYLQSPADYSGLLAKAFDLPSSVPPEAFGLAAGDQFKGDLADSNEPANTISATFSGRGTTPATANSSVSSSSTELAGEETLGKYERNGGKKELQEEEVENKEPKEDVDDDDDEGGDLDSKVKKVNKPRKKGEKRQREPRFAFMTRSEVDHLEDGYRWRKYGQKAVKNSPYPRSYYRCTTQKCSVKKRVERSYQDPSTVITTYEGQHTHHCPASIRGNSHSLANPSVMAPTFRHDLLLHQLPQLSAHNAQPAGDWPNNSAGCSLLQTLTAPLQQLHFPDNYDLLQEIFPSFINSSLQP